MIYLNESHYGEGPLGRGKHFKTDKEQSRERELSYKNKELQREVARLRKEVEKYRSAWGGSEEKEKEAPQPKLRVKDRTCYSCKEGKLKLKKFWKAGEDWYKRSCDQCDYSTRPKRWNEDVAE